MPLWVSRLLIFKRAVPGDCANITQVSASDIFHYLLASSGAMLLHSVCMVLVVLSVGQSVNRGCRL